MKRHLTTLFVAMAVLALAGTADARGRGMGRGGPGEGHVMHGGGPGMLLGLGPCVVDSPELALTEAQKAALKKLRDEGRDPAGDAMTARKKLGKELRDLVADPKATDAQIRAKAAEMRDRMQAEHDAQLERLLQARKVLTAEQLAKVPGIRKDCRGKRGDGPRGGGPRGDCPCTDGRPGDGPRGCDD